MSVHRCHTVNGVHVPGCYGCAEYGHHRCDCPPDNSTNYGLARRVSTMESRLTALESRAALLSSQDGAQ